MERVDFPTPGRPYLVANFVETIDGKIQGPGSGYWPIGSEADLASLLNLRAQCDAVIHGRQTALGHPHLDRLGSTEFQQLLAEYGGHDRSYAYVVLSAHPDEALLGHLDPAGRPVRVILVTTASAQLPAELPRGLEVWRCGEHEIDLPQLRALLLEQGLERCALEAGPRLFGAFVAARLVDELWVTIAPKLFGTAFGTPTMINGVLFEPDNVPVLELVSSRAVGDEMYLRYRFKEVKP